MNLIVVSSLTVNEGLNFRLLTMFAKKDLNYDVVIESGEENIDYYFNLLRKKGWYDFVDDFVVPEWRIEGVRVDTEMNYPRTIRAKEITSQTVPSLLGQIKMMREINF